ncbi:hypothetical protein CDSM653_02486 [Caldanaerobacter subterraneus subsp. pacificus DSM 12653]|uniref:Uncharacterized protein n=1 Tax=Caldanaerobacter subterraneus subsp. pacificus DSM 12653 TaxID=391606 RepID=A0A0F5PKQ3_9THEO|nr:hypothetical protein CDSM653_02486 [Caldanaerobacter subterraneus subsp. pacificus DSM 12653]
MPPCPILHIGPLNPERGEKMRSYDTMYVLSPDLNEE